MSRPTSAQQDWSHQNAADSIRSACARKSIFGNQMLDLIDALPSPESPKAKSLIPKPNERSRIEAAYDEDIASIPSSVDSGCSFSDNISSKSFPEVPEKTLYDPKSLRKRSKNLKRKMENITTESDAFGVIEDGFYKIVKNAVQAFLTVALRENGEPFKKPDVDKIVNSEVSLTRDENPEKTKSQCEREAIKKLHLEMQKIEDENIHIWPSPLDAYIVDLRVRHLRRYMENIMSGGESKAFYQQLVLNVVKSKAAHIKKTPEEDRSETMRAMMQNSVLKDRCEDHLCTVMAVVDLFNGMVGIDETTFRLFDRQYHEEKQKRQ